jgi:hypothetical protein
MAKAAKKPNRQTIKQRKVLKKALRKIVRKHK